MNQVADKAGLIRGLDEVEAWFGRMPDFRDARLLEFSLNANAACRLVVHTWLTADKAGADGQPLTDKHAKVAFALADVFALSLSGYGEGTILSRLYLREESDHVVLAWDPAWGVGGEITGKTMRVTVTPGTPGP